LEVHQRTDPNIRGIAIVDPEGTVLMATEPGLKDVGIHFRPHFQKALAGSLAISDLYISSQETGSVPSIAYVAAVKAGGRAVGLATIYVRASAFWTAIQSGQGR